MLQGRLPSAGCTGLVAGWRKATRRVSDGTAGRPSRDTPAHKPPRSQLQPPGRGGSCPLVPPCGRAGPCRRTGQPWLDVRERSWLAAGPRGGGALVSTCGRPGIRWRTKKPRSDVRERSRRAAGSRGGPPLVPSGSRAGRSVGTGGPRPPSSVKGAGDHRVVRMGDGDVDCDRARSTAAARRGGTCWRDASPRDVVASDPITGLTLP